MAPPSLRAGLLCAAASAAWAWNVFPLPREAALHEGAASVGSFNLRAAANVRVSERLGRTLDRYANILRGTVRRHGGLAASARGALNVGVELAIASDDETLGLDTACGYELAWDFSTAAAASTHHGSTLRHSKAAATGATAPATVRIRADTVYGAMYALETLSQLLEPCADHVAGVGAPAAGAATRAASLGLAGACMPLTGRITDSPTYSWRGLMLDTGRRFFPVSALQGIMDAMAASKMNVLHLHASDHCRWSVQSNSYHALTDALTGILGGFYTQADLAGIISYAADRGISVRPEFDIPGHSRCFIPLEPEGIQFCAPTDPTRSQLYGDPANKTYSIITSLFKEMAALFPDPIFHIGSDETSALGPCTVNSTFALERAVLEYVRDELNKTPAGWEEVLFDAGAATDDTIVYAWSKYSPVDIISAGRRAVDSSGAHFYLTRPATAPFPDGWSTFWYDISTGLNSTQKTMLLGGEASSWTDTYCYTQQCGSSTGPTPVGAALFPPSADAAFTASIGGMIFPRAFVSAAAFWNFNTTVSSSDPSFVSAVNALTTSVIARGGYACPVGCACDQLTACGKPYLPAPMPVAGDKVYGGPCADPITPLMNWTLTSSGQLMAAATAPGAATTASSGTPLCLTVAGYNDYPLTLGPCTSPSAVAWTHVPATSELVSKADGSCLDMRTSDSAVGTYDCGSGSGLEQPNQQWIVDPVSGFVVSLADGACLQAVNSSNED